MKTPDDLAAMLRLNTCGWGGKRIAGEPGCSHHTWGIGRRVLALVVVLAVPLNLVILGVAWRMTKDADAEIRQGLEYAAHSVAGAVDAELGKFTALARGLATSPSLLANNLEAFEEEARRAFQGTSEAWVVVADVGGRQLINTRAVPGQGLPRRMPAALEAQARALATGQMVVTGVRTGALNEDWQTSIEVPIYKDGVPFRALSVIMTTPGFLRLLDGNSLPRIWIAGLIDSDGKFIARIPDHERRVGHLASAGWRAVMGTACSSSRPSKATRSSMPTRTQNSAAGPWGSPSRNPSWKPSRAEPCSGRWVLPVWCR